MEASANTGITLDQLLAAKDERARRQRSWLDGYRQPLIALSLVTPGPIKESLRYQRLLEEGRQACQQMLRRHGLSVLAHATFASPAGGTALWSVNHPAFSLKRLCVDLEESHPLGRLWDFDLFCPQAGPIGRSAINMAGRGCLICSEPAHACSRSRRHPLLDVVTRVETLIDDYFARQ
ncbi:holo-ACP synthase [Aeromonas sp. RU39B]|jgi:holo-ACP synthase|uniref:citrate lyase holo-[acyl-carrier protein] synthase n=1 Tax=Aeromonas sp. RU39B TaxID=1907416 RepID=UPI0009548964|nr:citrate lyase holo-[acyl-carrier protein] synthase [Aeromonas sp. RU39B]SIR53345.1 holo-ACP synthase [Aeromonas sp. RU39B]